MVPWNTLNAMDLVIANSYADAMRSISVRNTWEFIPPKTLILDLSLSDWSSTAGGFVVCNYTTQHVNLDTIEPDFYQLAFKKLCLGNVMVWLSSIRSKYENLATPFGTLRLGSVINLI